MGPTYELLVATIEEEVKDIHSFDSDTIYKLLRSLYESMESEGIDIEIASRLTQRIQRFLNTELEQWDEESLEENGQPFEQCVVNCNMNRRCMKDQYDADCPLE